jgi:hypothetical protein
MMWLEVIRVRTFQSVHSVNIALSHMNAAKEKLSNIPDLDGAAIYCGLTSPFEAAIHLFWKSVDPVLSGGSAPGQQLTRDLAKFGMVDHFIWSLRNAWDAAAEGRAKFDADEPREEARI